MVFADELATSRRRILLAGMPVLRLAGYQPDASVHTRALRQFAATLRMRCGLGSTVEVVPDVTRQGARAAELPALVDDGSFDMCYLASSYLAARVEALGVLDMPFPTADRDTLHRKLDGEFGARLAAETAARSPFRVLGFWDNGLRHISNRLRPIRHPDDCGRMRLRTLDNALHREMFAALGFEPIFIDVKDLADAAARCVIDAQENPLTNFVNFGLYKFHRHVSLTSHLFGVALLLINRDRFDALAPELQGAIREAAVAATREQRALAAAEDARCRALLEAEGVDVIGPEDIDFSAFSARLATIIERERRRFVYFLDQT